MEYIQLLRLLMSLLTATRFAYNTEGGNQGVLCMCTDDVTLARSVRMN